MSRRQRQSFETAVSYSPLFKLPLELRNMIYEHLLVQEGGISIVHNAFKRIKIPAVRDRQRPAACKACSQFFSSLEELDLHHKRGRRCLISDRFSKLPDLPHATVSILRACRLIHLEAVPILYLKNSFCFSDPKTANDFRWHSDRTNAVLIQQIMITMVSTTSDQWLKYMEQKRSSLTQDFPNMKRMVINLGGFEFDVVSASRIKWTFERLARAIQGLEWLHVSRLNNVELIGYLKPIVTRKDSSPNTRRGVQKNVSDYEPAEELLQWWSNESTNSVGWKNVTLYWGPPGTTNVPYVRKPSDASRFRERLFRLGSGDEDSYSVGTSYI